MFTMLLWVLALCVAAAALRRIAAALVTSCMPIASAHLSFFPHLCIKFTGLQLSREHLAHLPLPLYLEEVSIQDVRLELHWAPLLRLEAAKLSLLVSGCSILSSTRTWPAAAAQLARRLSPYHMQQIQSVQRLLRGPGSPLHALLKRCKYIVQSWALRSTLLCTTVTLQDFDSTITQHSVGGDVPHASAVPLNPATPIGDVYLSIGRVCLSPQSSHLLSQSTTRAKRDSGAKPDDHIGCTTLDVAGVTIACGHCAGAHIDSFGPGRRDLAPRSIVLHRWGCKLDVAAFQSIQALGLRHFRLKLDLQANAVQLRVDTAVLNTMLCLGLTFGEFLCFAACRSRRPRLPVKKDVRAWWRHATSEVLLQLRSLRKDQKWDIMCMRHLGVFSALSRPRGLLRRLWAKSGNQMEEFDMRMTPTQSIVIRWLDWLIQQRDVSNDKVLAMERAVRAILNEEPSFAMMPRFTTEGHAACSKIVLQAVSPSGDENVLSATNISADLRLAKLLQEGTQLLVQDDYVGLNCGSIEVVHVTHQEGPRGPVRTVSEPHIKSPADAQGSGMQALGDCIQLTMQQAPHGPAQYRAALSSMFIDACSPGAGDLIALVAHAWPQPHQVPHLLKRESIRAHVRQRMMDCAMALSKRESKAWALCSVESGPISITADGNVLPQVAVDEPEVAQSAHKLSDAKIMLTVARFRATNSSLRDATSVRKVVDSAYSDTVTLPLSPVIGAVAPSGRSRALSMSQTIQSLTSEREETAPLLRRDFSWAARANAVHARRCSHTGIVAVPPRRQLAPCPSSSRHSFSQGSRTSAVMRTGSVLSNALSMSEVGDALQALDDEASCDIPSYRASIPEAFEGAEGEGRSESPLSRSRNRLPPLSKEALAADAAPTHHKEASVLNNVFQQISQQSQAAVQNLTKRCQNVIPSHAKRAWKGLRHATRALAGWTQLAKKKEPQRESLTNPAFGWERLGVEDDKSGTRVNISAEVHVRFLLSDVQGKPREQQLLALSIIATVKQEERLDQALRGESHRYIVRSAHVALGPVVHVSLTPGTLCVLMAAVNNLLKHKSRALREGHFACDRSELQPAATRRSTGDKAWDAYQSDTKVSQTLLITCGVPEMLLTLQSDSSALTSLRQVGTTPEENPSALHPSNHFELRMVMHDAAFSFVRAPKSSQAVRFATSLIRIQDLSHARTDATQNGDADDIGTSAASAELGLPKADMQDQGVVVLQTMSDGPSASLLRTSLSSLSKRRLLRSVLFSWRQLSASSPEMRFERQSLGTTHRKDHGVLASAHPMLLDVRPHQLLVNLQVIRGEPHREVHTSGLVVRLDHKAVQHLRDAASSFSDGLKAAQAQQQVPAPLSSHSEAVSEAACSIRDGLMPQKPATAAKAVKQASQALTVECELLVVTYGFAEDWAGGFASASTVGKLVVSSLGVKHASGSQQVRTEVAARELMLLDCCASVPQYSAILDTFADASAASACDGAVNTPQLSLEVLTPVGESETAEGIKTTIGVSNMSVTYMNRFISDTTRFLGAMQSVSNSHSSSIVESDTNKIDTQAKQASSIADETSPSDGTSVQVGETGEDASGEGGELAEAVQVQHPITIKGRNLCIVAPEKGWGSRSFALTLQELDATPTVDASTFKKIIRKHQEHSRWPGHWDIFSGQHALSAPDLSTAIALLKERRPAPPSATFPREIFSESNQYLQHCGRCKEAFVALVHHPALYCVNDASILRTHAKRAGLPIEPGPAHTLVRDWAQGSSILVMLDFDSADGSPVVTIDWPWQTVLAGESQFTQLMTTIFQHAGEIGLNVRAPEPFYPVACPQPEPPPVPATLDMSKDAEIFLTVNVSLGQSFFCTEGYCADTWGPKGGQGPVLAHVQLERSKVQVFVTRAHGQHIIVSSKDLYIGECVSERARALAQCAAAGEPLSMPVIQSTALANKESDYAWPDLAAPCTISALFQAELEAERVTHSFLVDYVIHLEGRLLGPHAIEVAFQHVNLTWPFLANLDLVWDIVRVYSDFAFVDWVDHAPPPANKRWFFINVVLRSGLALAYSPSVEVASSDNNARMVTWLPAVLLRWDTLQVGYDWSVPQHTVLSVRLNKFQAQLVRKLLSVNLGSEWNMREDQTMRREPEILLPVSGSFRWDLTRDPLFASAHHHGHSSSNHKQMSSEGSVILPPSALLYNSTHQYQLNLNAVKVQFFVATQSYVQSLVRVASEAIVTSQKPPSPPPLPSPPSPGAVSRPLVHLNDATPFNDGTSVHFADVSPGLHFLRSLDSPQAPVPDPRQSLADILQGPPPDDISELSEALQLSTPVGGLNSLPEGAQLDFTLASTNSGPIGHTQRHRRRSSLAASMATPKSAIKKIRGLLDIGDRARSLTQYARSNKREAILAERPFIIAPEVCTRLMYDVPAARARSLPSQFPGAHVELAKRAKHGASQSVTTTQHPKLGDVVPADEDQLLYMHRADSAGMASMLSSVPTMASLGSSTATFVQVDVGTLELVVVDSNGIGAQGQKKQKAASIRAGHSKIPTLRFTAANTSVSMTETCRDGLDEVVTKSREGSLDISTTLALRFFSSAQDAETWFLKDWPVRVQRDVQGSDQVDAWTVTSAETMNIRVSPAMLESLQDAMLLVELFKQGAAEFENEVKKARPASFGRGRSNSRTLSLLQPGKSVAMKEGDRFNLFEVHNLTGLAMTCYRNDSSDRDTRMVVASTDPPKRLAFMPKEDLWHLSAIARKASVGVMSVQLEGNFVGSIKAIENVIVTAVGFLAYPLKPRVHRAPKKPRLGFPYALVVNVEVLKRTKVIKIQTPFQLVNQTDLGLNFKVQVQAHRDAKRNFGVKPVFQLPITQRASSSRAVLRHGGSCCLPLTALTEDSQAISMYVFHHTPSNVSDSQNKHGSTIELQAHNIPQQSGVYQCYSASAEDVFVCMKVEPKSILVVPPPRQEADEYVKHEYITSYTLTFVPPLVIRNFMPSALRFQLAGGGADPTKYVLGPGASKNMHHWHSARDKIVDMEIDIPGFKNYVKKTRRVSLHKHATTRVICDYTSNDYYPHPVIPGLHGLRACFSLQYDHDCKQLQVSVWSPFWLVNKTGVPLDVLPDKHLKPLRCDSSRQVTDPDKQAVHALGQLGSNRLWITVPHVADPRTTTNRCVYVGSLGTRGPISLVYSVAPTDALEEDESVSDAERQQRRAGRDVQRSVLQRVRFVPNAPVPGGVRPFGDGGFGESESAQRSAIYARTDVLIHTSMCHGMYRGTRLVSVTPAYVFTNTTGVPLEVCQQRSNAVMTVLDGETRVLHWFAVDGKPELMIRPVTLKQSWRWSGVFGVGEVKHYDLRLSTDCDTQYAILPVDISFQNTYICSIGKPGARTAPYRIENLSKRYVILYHQKHSPYPADEQTWHLLRSEHGSREFAWDGPHPHAKLTLAVIPKDTELDALMHSDLQQLQQDLTLDHAAKLQLPVRKLGRVAALTKQLKARGQRLVNNMHDRANSEHDMSTHVMASESIQVMIRYEGPIRVVRFSDDDSGMVCQGDAGVNSRKRELQRQLRRLYMQLAAVTDTLGRYQDEKGILINNLLRDGTTAPTSLVERWFDVVDGATAAAGVMQNTSLPSPSPSIASVASAAASTWDVRTPTTRPRSPSTLGGTAGRMSSARSWSPTMQKRRRSLVSGNDSVSTHGSQPLAEGQRPGSQTQRDSMSVSYNVAASFRRHDDDSRACTNSDTVSLRTSVTGLSSEGGALIASSHGAQAREPQANESDRSAVIDDVLHLLSSRARSRGLSATRRTNADEAGPSAAPSTTAESLDEDIHLDKLRALSRNFSRGLSRIKLNCPPAARGLASSSAGGFSGNSWHRTKSRDMSRASAGTIDGAPRSQKGQLASIQTQSEESLLDADHAAQQLQPRRRQATADSTRSGSFTLAMLEMRRRLLQRSTSSRGHTALSASASRDLSVKGSMRRANSAFNPRSRRAPRQLLTTISGASSQQGAAPLTPEGVAFRAALLQASEDLDGLDLCSGLKQSMLASAAKTQPATTEDATRDTATGASASPARGVLQEHRVTFRARSQETPMKRSSWRSRSAAPGRAGARKPSPSQLRTKSLGSLSGALEALGRVGSAVRGGSGGRRRSPALSEHDLALRRSVSKQASMRRSFKSVWSRSCSRLRSMVSRSTSRRSIATSGVSVTVRDLHLLSDVPPLCALSEAPESYDVSPTIKAALMNSASSPLGRKGTSKAGSEVNRGSSWGPSRGHSRRASGSLDTDLTGLSPQAQAAIETFDPDEFEAVAEMLTEYWDRKGCPGPMNFNLSMATAMQDTAFIKSVSKVLKRPLPEPLSAATSLSRDQAPFSQADIDQRLSEQGAYCSMAGLRGTTDQTSISSVTCSMRPASSDEAAVLPWSQIPRSRAGGVPLGESESAHVGEAPSVGDWTHATTSDTDIGHDRASNHDAGTLPGKGAVVTRSSHESAVGAGTSADLSPRIPAHRTTASADAKDKASRAAARRGPSRLQTLRPAVLLQIGSSKSPRGGPHTSRTPGPLSIGAPATSSPRVHLDGKPGASRRLMFSESVVARHRADADGNASEHSEESAQGRQGWKRAIRSMKISMSHLESMRDRNIALMSPSEVAAGVTPMGINGWDSATWAANRPEAGKGIFDGPKEGTLRIELHSITSVPLSHRGWTSQMRVLLQCSTLLEVVKYASGPVTLDELGNGQFNRDNHITTTNQAFASLDDDPSLSPFEEVTIRNVPMDGIVALTLVSLKRLRSPVIAHAVLRLDDVRHLSDVIRQDEVTFRVPWRTKAGAAGDVGEVEIKAAWVSTALEQMEMRAMAMQQELTLKYELLAQLEETYGDNELDPEQTRRTSRAVALTGTGTLQMEILEGHLERPSQRSFRAQTPRQKTQVKVFVRGDNGASTMKTTEWALGDFPTWNKPVTFDRRARGDTLVVQMFAFRRLGMDVLLGEAKLSLADLPNEERPQYRWINLKPRVLTSSTDQSKDDQDQFPAASQYYDGASDRHHTGAPSRRVRVRLQWLPEKRSACQAVDLMLQGIGVSLVDVSQMAPREVVYINVMDIQAHLRANTQPDSNEESGYTKQELDVRIQNIQIDNQLLETMVPVILCRRHNTGATDEGLIKAAQRNIEMQRQGAPLLQLQLERHIPKQSSSPRSKHTDGDDGIFLKRAHVAVEPLDICVEEAFLDQLQLLYKHWLDKIQSVGIGASVVGANTELFGDTGQPSKSDGRIALRALLETKCPEAFVADAARQFKKWFFESMTIAEMSVYITLRPSVEAYSRDRVGSSLIRAAAAAGLSMTELDDVHIKFSEYRQKRKYAMPSELTTLVSSHYAKQLWTALSSVLGHVEVIGSTIALGSSILAHTWSLFYQPLYGMRSGSAWQDIMATFLASSSALVLDVGAGIFFVFAQITRGIGKGIGKVSLVRVPMDHAARRKPKSLTYAVIMANLDLQTACKLSAKSIVKLPQEGWRDAGFLGALAGTVKGVSGLLLPVATIFDVTSRIVQGIGAEIVDIRKPHGQLRKLNPPRRDHAPNVNVETLKLETDGTAHEMEWWTAVVRDLHPALAQEVIVDRVLNKTERALLIGDEHIVYVKVRGLGTHDLGVTDVQMKLKPHCVLRWVVHLAQIASIITMDHTIVLSYTKEKKVGMLNIEIPCRRYISAVDSDVMEFALLRVNKALDDYFAYQILKQKKAPDGPDGSQHASQERRVLQNVPMTLYDHEEPPVVPIPLARLGMVPNGFTALRS